MRVACKSCAAHPRTVSLHFGHAVRTLSIEMPRLMIVYRFWLLSVLVLLPLVRAESQRRPPPGPIQQRNTFFITTFAHPSSDRAKSTLDIFFRAPESFFVFTRDDGSGSPDALSAIGEFSVEIRDKHQIPVTRQLTNQTIRRRNDSPGGDDTSSTTGSFSFDLPPAEYFIRFEATDHESRRVYRDDSLRVNLIDFSPDSTRISDLLFVAPQLDSLRMIIQPLGYGRILPLGMQSDMLFQVSCRCSIPNLNISYEITSISHEQVRPVQVVLRDTLSRTDLSPASAYTLPDQQLAFRSTDTLLSNTFEARFKLRADTLEQGNYKIEIHVSNGLSAQSSVKEFSIRWLGMPLSLRYLPGAVLAMKYILPEEEFDNLSSAGDEEQRKLFEAYWKRHDNTPATAFNEVMEEYYRRVDHAMVAFVTLKEENGMKSDRGKVYILYGPPTRVDRKLIPSSAPQEIWYYERLKKKFVFVDPSRLGDYKLLSMDTL